jgi:hypothetical protein
MVCKGAVVDDSHFFVFFCLINHINIYSNTYIIGAPAISNSNTSLLERVERKSGPR